MTITTIMLYLHKFKLRKTFLKVALTYNVKQETDDSKNDLLNAARQSDASKYIHRELVENYPERIDDTYAEWDSMETIDAVKSALEAGGHDVTLVEADVNAFTKIKDLNPEFVFNVAEGYYGASRESQIPAMLEMLNIPFTGSDSITIGICHDKSRCKEILSYYNIPNAKFVLADSLDAAKNINLDFPLIVKPISEGSSKGIFSSSFVRDNNELLREVERVLVEYNQPALIEEFLQGREFTVAILGNGSEAEVLPIVEISYNGFPKDFVPIYSYEAKWILDTKENPLDVFSCPAKIDLKLEKKINDVALKTYSILRCKDWSRIDVRLDKNNEPNIIEINPLPGILPDPDENSCFPKAARTKGLNYQEMINKVLYVAAKRYKLI